MHLHCRWIAVVGFSACLGLGWAADKKEDAKLSKEEQLLVDLANQARKNQKLPALKVNALLNKAAAGYSRVMIKNAKKAVDMMLKKDHKVHELDGTDPGKRFDAVGYDYTEYGENVAMAYKLDQMGTVHERWMKSKVHSDNILESKFVEIGIAVVKHPDRNEWYITQVFGTR